MRLMSKADLSLRLLLGDAVDGSTFNHETAGIETDNILTGEAFAENAQSSVVFLRLLKDGYNDCTIANQEVSIACRQLL